jgi:hypothetical protein
MIEPRGTNDSLTDDELIAGFEAASLAAFHHRDHVRVAWIYLRRLGLHGALAAVSHGLQRMSAAKGQAAKYHETVSWLYVFVIHERLAGERAAEAGAGAGWEAFVAANPDLFGNWGGFAKRFYTPRTLGSPLARRTFVLPDRIGGL